MKEKESVIDFSGLPDVFSTTAIIPEQKKLSEKIKLDYQGWYSSCCALLEMNYNKERANEFKSEYENKIKKLCHQII